MSIHDECIEWDGATIRGYGCTRKNVGDRGTQYVHRLAWEEAYGLIPSGLCVLHKCDNPPCFNVDHLFLGTKSDNTHDMMSKGRGKYETRNGVDHHNSKLNEALVREIRERVARGEEHRDIGKAIGVAHSTVGRVARRETWRHV